MANKRRRKKKNSDSYLYIAIGLIFVAVILCATIICLTVGCAPGDSESSSEPDSSVEAVESSEESKAVLDGWVTENGNKVYYNNGVLCKGAAEIDGSIYVFGDDGSLLKGGFVSVGKDVYYLNDQGEAHIGWLELDGKTYYLKSDGIMAVGETEIDGERHFFSSKGVEFVVANPWNSVPDDDNTLVTLPATYGSESRGKVDQSCYDDLIKMMDDCHAATGKNVYVVSGHRTFEYQENNYNNEVRVYLNQGYSQTEAEKLAAEWVAVPGTSEHHLGLAVDIIDTEIWNLVEEQENLEGQKWLMENSWKYGFILRYPKDGKAETGINYEPWHYRYLGEELAKEVYESGLTLEGYIKSLG